MHKREIRMKQSSKHEIDLLAVMSKIEAQMVIFDRKIDTLIQRSAQETKPIAKSNNVPMLPKSNDQHKGRMLHTAICADCKKECTIPFKPSGDRPVYCQDCFSRRKVINMSGIKVPLNPGQVKTPQVSTINTVETSQKPVKTKKKTITAKKPLTKKKTTPKKK